MLSNHTTEPSLRVKQTGYHFAYDSLGRTTGVSWSGKSDSESSLQTTTYQTGTGLVNET